MTINVKQVEIDTKEAKEDPDPDHLYQAAGVAMIHGDTDVTPAEDHHIIIEITRYSKKIPGIMREEDIKVEIAGEAEVEEIDRIPVHHDLVAIVNIEADREILEGFILREMIIIADIHLLRDHIVAV